MKRFFDCKENTCGSFLYSDWIARESLRGFWPSQLRDIVISKAADINEAPDDFLNTRNGKTNAMSR